VSLLCKGVRLSDAPPTVASGHKRREINDLSRHLHHNLRRALDGHAQLFLKEHGIDEPTTWHPPTNLAPSSIPGQPTSISHGFTSWPPIAAHPGQKAEEFGTSLAHVRLLFEEHPRPSRDHALSE
jgi:hypothetical protein